MNVRWMIRRDLDRVEVMEAGTNDPWPRDVLLKLLKQKNVLAAVCEHDGHLLGYMLYELHRDHYLLGRLVVCPYRRHGGVGSCMLEWLIRKLSESRRRSRITTLVDQDNLIAQLFFKHHGFMAVGTEGENYRFVLDRNPWAPQNRISKHLEKSMD